MSVKDNQLNASKRKVSRREFIKVGVTAAGAGAAIWAGNRLQVRENLTRGAFRAEAAASLEESLVRTACAMCPSGCGLEVRVVGGKAVKVEGNPIHPLNQGVCCLKGQASLEVLYSPERIRYPWRQLGARGSGDWEEISWDEALNLVVEKLTALRQSGKPHSLALVHGELRGEMRGLVNRFMQVFGSPNVIASTSLGEQSVRLVSFLTQGVNGLPVYDLNNASYVMTFGGNLLESSRHVISYLGSLAFGESWLLFTHGFL
jgi:anaerobic selenocysteine-containing dehydrogenase